MPHPLSAAFREGVAACRPGSPLYAGLLAAMADDLDAGGVTAAVLAGRERDRPGTVPSLRLLGALHRLVLTGRAPSLARHYPSAGGTEPPGAAWPAAERTLREHLAELRDLLSRTVQTNEPGRACLLYGGLQVAAQRAAATRGAGMAVRLLEVGASAGLMMLVDRYGYAVGDRVLGDPASGLRFEQPWVGWPPADVDVPPRIVERRGCDPNPIDPTTDEGRLTLMSYVWADWTERVERLHAALRLAAATPPPVDRARMADWLAAQLAVPRPGVLTVVWHSVVRQYVEQPERDAARAVLRAAGAAATTEAPLAHLRFEPRRYADGKVTFELRLTQWPGFPRDELLAIAPGHGIPGAWV
jgi:hypothetical protein